MAFRRERTFRYETKKLSPSTVEVSAPIYIGTRYFVALENGQAGNEIGFSKLVWDSHKEEIPFPPEMWFATEMLNALAECQCRSQGHPGCKYYYPGWSYNKNGIDYDVVRFEGKSGRFWLWSLNGERDEVNNREFGRWED